MYKPEQFFDDVANTILSNDNLRDTFHQGVLDLFNSITSTFVENNSYNSKILNHTDSEHAYIFIHDKKRNQINVYEESKRFEKNDHELFRHTKTHLIEEHDEAYSTDLCCTLNYNQPTNRNAIPTYKQKIRGDLFCLKRFVDLLNIQHIFTEDLLTKLSGLSNTKSSLYTEELLSNFNKIKSACKRNKLDSDNIHSFNDMDHSLWQEGEGVVFTEQNISFYAVGDKTNLHIYAYDSAEYDLKSKTTLEELIPYIQEKPNDLIGHTVLKIEDSKITFTDPGLLYNLYFDLYYTADEVRDNLKTPRKSSPK